MGKRNKDIGEAEAHLLPSDRLLERYDWEEVFGNTNEVEVELGAGDGGFILAYAEAHRERNFVAVERLMGRSRKIVKRGYAAGLENLRTLRLESFYFIKCLCERGSVSVVHVMFPDPWPKKKHHKRRLVQHDFLDALRDCLKAGGEWRFTTDHEEYFRWVEEKMEERDDWERMELWEWECDPLTDFQKEFMEEGREFYRGRWRPVK